MASITIRDLPDSVLEKVRFLSKKNRRSINSELLVLIAHGVDEQPASTYGPISPETQTELWLQMAGMWDDDRSTDEIVNDIYSSRSEGRAVSL